MVLTAIQAARVNTLYIILLVSLLGTLYVSVCVGGGGVRIYECRLILILRYFLAAFAQLEVFVVSWNINYTYACVLLILVHAQI